MNYITTEFNKKVIMKVKLLHSYGKSDINEYEFYLPEMSADQIMIKTIMTGVCRSDVMAYSGNEDPMPLGRFGHEGLGIVTAVGRKVKDVKVGDFVSTISDPAYADYYYATENELVVVPEASSKYILQPVACAMNIIHKTKLFMDRMGIPKDEPILLLGTGFMSMIIGQYCIKNGIVLDVVGKSNENIWADTIGIATRYKDDILYSIEANEKYKVVIDLTSKAETFDDITKLYAAPEALICYASTPSTPVITNFFDNCWNCHTIILPSPRNLDFKKIMEWTRDLVDLGVIDPSKFWTRGYDRNNMEEVKAAFEDGKNRTKDYIRGYLEY